MGKWTCSKTPLGKRNTLTFNQMPNILKILVIKMFLPVAETFLVIDKWSPGCVWHKVCIYGVPVLGYN